MNVRYRENYDDVRIGVMTTYDNIVKDTEVANTKNRLQELQDAIESRFLAIANTLGGTTVKDDYKPMAHSKISALDVEINRSRNKLKYMEAQLFPSGMPSGKSSEH